MGWYAGTQQGRTGEALILGLVNEDGEKGGGAILNIVGGGANWFW